MSEHKFRVGEELWLTWPENNGSVSILHVRVTDSRRDANPGYELKALEAAMRFSAPYWVTNEQAAKWLTREPPTTQRVDSVSRAEPALASEPQSHEDYLAHLRREITNQLPATAFATIQYALGKHYICDAEARELLNMPCAVATPPPDVEEFLAYEGNKSLELDTKESAELVVSLMGQLDAERQRACRLSDELGHANTNYSWAMDDAYEYQTKVLDLESTIRSKDKQIAALKAKLLLLNRTCR